MLIKGKVNQMALKGDIEGLKEVLEQYKGLVINTVGIFKTPKGETKNLFNLD